jgi:DNA (cytosine-5)-methyltransferase 1
MMNHLDLFSGIGGFSLGLEATGGFKTVGFCEIEPYCQQVLKRHWPDVPIYNDVRGFKHDGAVDIVTGGYPCQPFSTAGKRKGQSDPRPQNQGGDAHPQNQTPWKRRSPADSIHAWKIYFGS